MSLNIDTARYRDQPLTFRTFLENDYVAEIDGLRAGWILSGEKKGVRVWWWTMTGPCCGHGRVPSYGESASLEEAKEQFRVAFGQWRQWALSEEVPVRWFGTAYQAAESTFLPKNP